MTSSAELSPLCWDSEIKETCHKWDITSSHGTPSGVQRLLRAFLMWRHWKILPTSELQIVGQTLPNDGFQQPLPSNPRWQERISLKLIPYYKDLESPLNLRFVWIVEADEGRPFQMWWRQIVVPLFYEWGHQGQQELPVGCTRACAHFFGFFFFFWKCKVKLFLMWNEIIKASVSKLAALRGAETFMSTILLFEVWCREPGLLCGTLFRLCK